MLERIDCPSYIQTQQVSDDGEHRVDVAMVPYEQFHTFMTMVATNNTKLVEVNTLLDDIYKAYGDDAQMRRCFVRLEKYLVFK